MYKWLRHTRTPLPLDWHVQTHRSSHFSPPVSHWTPVHPTLQVQVPWAVQAPPFRHGLAQVAESDKQKTWMITFYYILNEHKYTIQHACTLRDTPTPLSIRLAGSTVWSLQCVAYITGVGHYRVVGCTGETALAICRSTRITTVDSCSRTEIR